MWRLFGIEKGETCPSGLIGRGKHALGAGWVMLG